MFADILPVDSFWSLLCTMSMAPVGYMLGSTCSPCCGPQGCGVSDGKPRTDPATEGHWVPSGNWVTWTFDPAPSTTDGGTWFFYGSAATSKPGGSATLSEQRDWGNICNWYSNKTTTPSSASSLAIVLNKRATRLPPEDAIVHIQSPVRAPASMSISVKNAYFWGYRLFSQSVLSVTSSAHDSQGGCVFGLNAVADESIVNGGATFSGSSETDGSTINGGAEFYNTSRHNQSSVVNGGAVFYGSSANANNTVINDGAVFNDLSINGSGTTINGGATFNDSARNFSQGVNGGATFNDGARSHSFVGSFANCPGVGRRIFVAHPTDLPTCNGTAPDGCASAADNSGCG
jgi:hypothetical protein